MKPTQTYKLQAECLHDIMKTPITDREACNDEDICAQKYRPEGWVPSGVARELEEIATESLRGFKVTQHPADYPADHWSRRMEILISNVKEKGNKPMP